MSTSKMQMPRTASFSLKMRFLITKTKKEKFQITNPKLQTNYKSRNVKLQIPNKKRKKRKLERSEGQPAEITNSKKTQISRINWAARHLLFRILVIVIWNLFVICNFAFGLHLECLVTYFLRYSTVFSKIWRPISSEAAAGFP